MLISAKLESGKTENPTMPWNFLGDLETVTETQFYLPHRFLRGKNWGGDNNVNCLETPLLKKVGNK